MVHSNGLQWHTIVNKYCIFISHSCRGWEVQDEGP
jgi:hypothetical protein